MAKGKVSQVIGTVVDVEFPPDELPALYNAVEISMGKEKIVLEVQDHLGNNWVRCLSLSPTDGLERGAEVVDTGAALRVPVGRATLGRLFDVMGTPLDNLGEVKTGEHWPIHRSAPPCAVPPVASARQATGTAPGYTPPPACRTGPQPG